MISALSRIERENSRHLSAPAPKSVQDTIPITKYYSDGIFELGEGKYSKTWTFTDVNYTDLAEGRKDIVFRKYEDLLNALDTDALVKITINNRTMDSAEFKKNILLPMEHDEYDHYRRDYNDMLLDKATSSNSITQDKYITVTVNKHDVQEARIFFNRTGAELNARFHKMGSRLRELTLKERIMILHDFYQPDNLSIDYDPEQDMRMGNSPTDFIAPQRIGHSPTMLRVGGKYTQSLYLLQYASAIDDGFLNKMVDIDKNMMLSIDILNIPMEEAMKEAENKRLAVESNITSWNQKQISENNFAAEIPYEMQQARAETKEFLDDMNNRNQRMFLAAITMTVMADNEEELQEETEQIMASVRAAMCQMSRMQNQQLEGIVASMPIGTNDNFAWSARTLTTEALAAFMPFKVKDIRHTGGIYYGQNKISKNLIIVDRHSLKNGNSFILGVSGAGKSFTGKNEVINVLLRNPNADVMVIDPEREYTKLCNAFHGSLCRVSSTSNIHINAMDINEAYGEGADPVTEKCEFVMSLCELIIGEGRLGPQYKSIIDRCTRTIYLDYQKNGYKGKAPTLVDLKRELEAQEEVEAKDIAVCLELFATGSLSTFAKKTNVDTSNRFMVYDIQDLGEQMMTIGMLVVLDSILNRITKNREEGRQTYIFIDEIYLLFMHEYSSEFLYKLWKRVRKYNAMCTGITQNVEDLLQSSRARALLANSEFIIMLSQAPTDRITLSELLNISEDQQKHIIDVETGSGLMKIGETMVPFENRFPKNSLYELMHTDPKEKE